MGLGFPPQEDLEVVACWADGMEPKGLPWLSMKSPCVWETGHGAVHSTLEDGRVGTGEAWASSHSCAVKPSGATPNISKAEEVAQILVLGLHGPLCLFVCLFSF